MAESKISSRGLYIGNYPLALGEGNNISQCYWGGGDIKIKKRKECEEKRGRTKDKGEIEVKRLT
jgi:hypothetical protein